MSFFYSRVFVAAMCCLILGCTGNILQSYATTNDESLLYSAKSDIRSGNYSSAITDCSSISATALTTEPYATVCASAYAGNCGFSISTMETDLSSFSAPWGTYVLNNWGSTATSAISDCDSAETILRNVGAAASRTPDENFFMLTLSLYKIGVIEKALADANNDKLVDAGFDACALATSPTNYQQMTAEAVWDMAQAANQLQSDTLVSSFATLLFQSVAPLGECPRIAAITGSGGKVEDICSATSISFNSDQIRGALSFLKEGTVFGVNQSGCGGNTIDTAGCYCP